MSARRYSPRLEPREIEEALRQNYDLWGDGRSMQEHLSYNREQLRRAGPELLRYVGLVEDGEVVASIKRYGLHLFRHGRTLGAAGIGAVFTRADRRGEGLAAELVRAVLGEAKGGADAAAFLYSDIDPLYYARLGFVAIGADEHEAKVSELPRADPFELRPALESEHPRLLELYEESWAASPDVLRASRTLSMYRYFTFRNRVHGAYLLSDGGREIGYLLATRDDPMRDLPDLRGDALWVDEAFARDAPRARVLATIHALAQHAGVARVRAWLRPSEVTAPFESKPRREAIPMIAPLDASLDIDPRRAFLDAFGHF